MFNNGWSGCNFWNKTDFRNFEEVMTHEMGHAFGLAHSSDGTPSEFAAVAGDGRVFSPRGWKGRW